MYGKNLDEPERTLFKFRQDKYYYYNPKQFCQHVVSARC